MQHGSSYGLVHLRLIVVGKGFTTQDGLDLYHNH